MKRILLAGLCLIVSGHGLFAQNKTLGVGVATPNPNAALHVESPTGNQGFIMPRMTSAQRFASSFTSVLNATDKGLMVFDTDLNTIFIWNGSNWQNTGDVAGGVKLKYPYVDSVTSGTGTNDLIAFKYAAAEPKRILRVENHSITNGSSALSVYNAGSGLSAYFQVANPASTSSTVWATTNSDAGGALAPVAIYGESTGIGSLGGSFRTQNPANPHPALFAESKGTGTAIMAVTSTGFSAIQGEAVGGFSNGVSGISSSPETGSYAVLGQNSGGGPAGVFTVSNAANASHALDVSTSGTGAAGVFTVNNVSNDNSAIIVNTNGAGDGGYFQIDNTNSTNTAVKGRAVNAGGGAAAFEIFNASNPHAAVYATTSGTGNAGTFVISGPGNASPSVAASTQGTGAAIQADQQNNGMAIEMVNGGLKYSVATISVVGAITQVAALYKVTVAGTVALPTSVPEGTFCKVFNGSGGGVTVDPVYVMGSLSTVLISGGTIADFIFINGNWYENP